MEVQEGLASPFKQKIGYTQMLRFFRDDTSNALIYPFQFLRDKDHFLMYGHILKKYFILGLVSLVYQSQVDLYNNKLLSLLWHMVLLRYVWNHRNEKIVPLQAFNVNKFHSSFLNNSL